MKKEIIYYMLQWQIYNDEEAVRWIIDSQTSLLSLSKLLNTTNDKEMCALHIAMERNVSCNCSDINAMWRTKNWFFYSYVIKFY